MKRNISIILTSISYGVYPALIVFLINDNHLNHINKILLGFVVVGAKEIFTWIILNFYLGPQKILKLYKNILTKPGIINAVFGVIGGPIGYVLLTISSFYIGSAISSLLMTLTAPLSAIFEVIFLKRKITFNVIIACVLSLIGSCLIVMTSINDFHNNKNLLLGVILVLVVVSIWAIESIMIDMYLNEKKKLDVNTIITLKLTSSVFILVIFLLPITSLITTNKIFEGLYDITYYFSDINLLIPILIIGVVMLVARLSYIYTVKQTSSTVTTIAYNLSTVITPLLILSMDFIFKQSHKGDVAIISTWKFWIALFLMLSGAMISKISFNKKLQYKIN